MYIEYPETVGIKLSPERLDTTALSNLNRKLPQECIIHIYGMHYTGSSTIGNKIANLIKGTLIDKGVIISAIAYQISEHKEWYDNRIFQPYFESLSFQKNSTTLIPIVQGKPISIVSLKSNRVITLVRKLIQDKKFVESLNNYISSAIQELSGSRIIIVDTSAVSKYLTEEQLGNRQVLNILLTSNLPSLRSRYLESRLSEYKQMNIDFEPNSEILQTIELDFHKQILEKNELLLEMLLEGEEGIIAQEGYLLDTSFLSLETSTSTILKALEFAYIL
jgi:hypothetical protein